MQQKKRKIEKKFPQPKGQRFVACPMMAKFEVLIDVSYCRENCEYYNKILTTEQGKDDELLCKFPRKIKIYNAAG